MNASDVYDEIQGLLRETRYSRQLDRIETSFPVRHEYGVYLLKVEERTNRDLAWLGTPEAAKELSDKKYRDRYVYVGYGGVAGFGRTVRKAAENAERNTGNTPAAELIHMAISY